MTSQLFLQVFQTHILSVPSVFKRLLQIFYLNILKVDRVSYYHSPLCWDAVHVRGKRKRGERRGRSHLVRASSSHRRLSEWPGACPRVNSVRARRGPIYKHWKMFGWNQFWLSGDVIDSGLCNTERCCSFVGVIWLRPNSMSRDSPVRSREHPECSRRVCTGGRLTRCCCRRMVAPLARTMPSGDRRTKAALVEFPRLQLHPSNLP
jgi:hypothetical protein